MTSDQQTRAQLTTPSDREIVTTRVFDAPRERVWAAITVPDLIPRWWGLKASTTVVDQLDLRPGGAWRFVQLNAGMERGLNEGYEQLDQLLASGGSADH